jgi:hypothetical protein
VTIAAAATRAAVRRVPRRLPDTVPGRLRLLLVAALAVAVAVGLATGLVLAREQHVVASLATDAGPASIDTARVHAALSEADQVAATSFLSGGAEHLGGAGPAYQENIRVATQGLAGVAAANPAGRTGAEEVQAAEALIVVYIGLIDQAHANADRGPLGVAYLAYASDLMHAPKTGILAQVDQLATLDATQVARRGSSPWLSSAVIVAQLAGGVVLVGLLIGLQVFLARRFRRVLNPALCAATALAIVLLALTTLQVTHTRSEVRRGTAALADGTGVWTARAVLADAYGARARSLIVPAASAGPLPAPGTAGAADSLRVNPTATDDDAKRFSDLLAPALRGGDTDAEQAAAAYREFMTADGKVAGRVAAGGTDNINKAVSMTLSSGADAIPAPFRRVDDALDKAAGSAQRRFDTAMHAAAAQHRLVAGIPVLTGAVMLLLILGMFPRLAEYRP